MEEKGKNEYEYYIKKYNFYSIYVKYEVKEKIEKYLGHSFTETGILPFKIVAKAGMKTLAEWEIDRIPSDEFLKKNNIDIEKSTIRSALPSIIEENFKQYKSYYSEEEIKYLRYLLSKYCEVSDDKLNEIFGYKDKIAEMINSMIPIQSTEFSLLNKNKFMDKINYDVVKYLQDIKITNFDVLFEEMYSSSIINGGLADTNILVSDVNKYITIPSIYNLNGLNRQDLSSYSRFFYTPQKEELKEREYILLAIFDIVPRVPDRILHIAPIVYPKDSKLTITEIIQNYIYSTFYTVSETTQRRFITFLQKYCNENQKQYTKIKNNNNF